jgi:hypothetical protein
MLAHASVPILCNKRMFCFKHPTTLFIAATTHCGKTYFFISELKNKLIDKLIQPKPHRIVWVYGAWQNAYAELQRELPQTEFVKNYRPELHESFGARVRDLVVLDDHTENRSAHKFGTDSVVKFFTQGSHHRNMAVVYIVQNRFNQDKSMRTVSLNAHYIIVFKNPRGGTQMQTFDCQMFPGNPTPLLDAFKDATTVTSDDSGTARGYLLLDFHPTSCDALRMLTNVFHECPTAHVPQEYITGARVNGESLPSGSESNGSRAPSSTFSINRRTERRFDAQRKRAKVTRKA